MKKWNYGLIGMVLVIMSFSIPVSAQNALKGVFDIDQTGAHRGTAVNQKSGMVYISNTTDREIKMFKWDNQTDVVDGSFIYADWAAWLGPYGIGVADDGMVYIATYRGSASGVYQASADGSEVNLIADLGESLRGLYVTGSDTNTVVYTLTNGGDLYKITTSDGTTFSHAKLFSPGVNASVAVSADGSTIFTAGFGSEVKKWDGAGNEDTTFTSPAANAVAIALNEKEDYLYVATTGTDDNLIKYDISGDSVVVKGTIPVNASGNVVSIDVLNNKYIYWASSNGRRGMVQDSAANAIPIANAGADQMAVVNSPVALDGSGSLDRDEDTFTYSWSVISAPEAVTLSDPTAVNPSFTPTTAGEYTFALVINDGTDSSEEDQVVVTVVPGDIVNDWNVVFSGAHRGTGVSQLNGRVYIANTTDDMVHYFDHGNTSDTPDGSFQHPDMAGWLGPYGLDVADDGMVYIASYRGSASGVFQANPDGSVVNKILETGSLRTLSVTGSGVNTVIYYAASGGDIYKATTEDGETFTAALLFSSGQDASIAVAPSGDTLYTVGYNSNMKKWSTSGVLDTLFVKGVAADTVSVVAARFNPAGTALYAMYNKAVGSDNSVYIGKVDPATGAILTETKIGPSENPSPIWAAVNTFDIMDDGSIYWASSNGYRGKAVDITAPKTNHAPWVEAGPDQSIVLGHTVDLDGYAVDIDDDDITTAWAVVSAPETVNLSDPSALNPNFTPTVVGDFVFTLTANDGTVDSNVDTVKVTVFSRDLNLTFEDDSDLDNWGVFHEGMSGFTVVEHGIKEGVVDGTDTTNAIKFKDGGYGFFIEREISATVGTAFRLTAKVKTDGTPSEMLFQVVEITGSPVSVDIHEFTEYTEITIEGFAVADKGYIQIKGTAGFGAYYVYLDDLVYDDDATVTRYTISGNVALGDAPENSSGSTVALVGYENYFTATTDDSGDYSIPNVVSGIYDIQASKVGYQGVLKSQIAVVSDTTIDFALPRNIPPVANAGDDQTGVSSSAFVRLDGTASSDTDGDSLRYTWTEISAPETIVFDNNTSAAPGFRVIAKGDYIIQLVVNDGTENSVPDTVVVSVTEDAPSDLASLAYTYDSDMGDEKNNIHGVGVDPDGKIWVGAYGGGEKLQVYNPDGTEADFSPISSGQTTAGDAVDVAGACRGIAVAPNGNIIYSKNGAILEFDYKTGASVGGILWTNGSPTNPAVDDSGNIYIGQVVGSKVWAYNSSWEYLGEVEVGSIGRAIEISPDGGTLFAAGFNSVSMFRGSIDTSFAAVPGGLPGPWKSIRSMDFGPNGLLWVCDETVPNTTKDGVVYALTPDLSHRIPVMTGDDISDPTGIAFSTDSEYYNAYVIDFATHRLMKWTQPNTSVDEENVNLPSEFVLHQNYPNPFNPLTTIRYELPKASHVTLVVYNILGQKVRTLVNHTEMAGKKTVRWDGTNDYGVQVATGIYILRIEAAGYVKALKMSFVK